MRRTALLQGYTGVGERGREVVRVADSPGPGFKSWGNEGNAGRAPYRLDQGYNDADQWQVVRSTSGESLSQSSTKYVLSDINRALRALQW